MWHAASILLEYETCSTFNMWRLVLILTNWTFSLKADLKSCSPLFLLLVFSPFLMSFWQILVISWVAKTPWTRFCCHVDVGRQTTRETKKGHHTQTQSLGFKGVGVIHSHIVFQAQCRIISSTYFQVVNASHKLIQNTTNGCKCRSAKSVCCIQIQSK